MWTTEQVLFYVSAEAIFLKKTSIVLTFKMG